MPMTTISTLLLLFFLLQAQFRPTHSLRFYLADRERRCFKFEAAHNARVLGQRAIANGRGHAVLSIQVKSADGTTVYSSESGDPKDSKFAFMTPARTDVDDDHYDYEDYETDATFTACLMLAFDAQSHRADAKRAVMFWIRPDTNPDTQQGTDRAKDEDVTRVQHSMQTMHMVLSQIVKDLTELQQREKRLTIQSELTGNILVRFALVSLLVLIVTAVLQLRHFKSFFKAKKLL